MNDLGLTAKRGARRLLVAQLAKFFINMASLVLLSRLLSPSDFGYAAIAGALVGIGEVVRDLGLSTAAIRMPSLTRGQRDVLFWSNLIVGLLLAVVIFFSATLLGRLFGEPLVDIARWLSLVFVFGGLAAQYRAGLNRDLRFDVIARTDVAAAFISFIVALVLALNGANYWAIVFQQIVMSFVVLVVFVAAGRWIPGIPRRGQNVAELFRFGLNVSFSQAVSYAGNNIDTLVIGHFFPPAIVGLYNRAQQLVTAPLNQLKNPANTVALPALSRVQGEDGQFLHFLSRGQLLIGYTVLPVAALLGAAARPVVNIALGDQWTAAAPVASILVIAAGLQQMSSVANWTFLARGLGRQLSWYSVLSFVLKFVVVLAMSPFGIMAVAAGYVGAVLILWPISIYWAMRSVGLPVRGLLAQGFSLFGVSLIAGLAGYLLLEVLHLRNDWVSCIAGVLGVCCVYGTSMGIPAMRRNLMYALGTIKESITGKR